ncbi:MAG: response regulator [Bryobacteraceae bacterium]|nr:response regulator [Bryobacteraceae bacterium]
MRLLLVDDEAALARLLSGFLERQGFEVSACESAEAALPLFQAEHESIDAVIADLTLPGMQGDEMVRRMLAIAPRMPVIISSGYPFSAEAYAGFQVSVLQKPYLPKTLAALLEDLTGRAGKTGA